MSMKCGCRPSSGARRWPLASPVPVHCVPLPVVAPPPSAYRRSHFDLPDDVFVFLFTFDVSSQMERKNPLGVISAFRAAFGARRDVMLVLKFTNAEYDPPGVRSLYRAVRRHQCRASRRVHGAR